MTGKVGAHPQGLGADPAFVASPSSQLAGSTKGFNPGEGWVHDLPDGSVDHEWVVEGGVTICAQCEQEKDCSE